MTTNSVSFELGTAGDLQSWFSFSPNVQRQPNSPPVLKDAIEHAINQTLLRDLFYGAWAVVSVPNFYTWNPDDKYFVRITSPGQDVSAYESTLPQFLKTIGKGLELYESRTKWKKDKTADGAPGVQNLLAKQRASLIGQSAGNKNPLTDAHFACSFLPPFGLSMVRNNSIQLLHYPPDETVTYMDYLYSPTNRRWENLLGYNAYPGAENTLLETIVDIAPIAAPGGSAGGDLIEPVLERFQPYAMSMLQTLLRPNKAKTTTQAVVAYGAPVGEWLWRNFQSQIEAQKVKTTKGKNESVRPNVGEVFQVNILEGGPSTPVMCANHPIKFNYYDKDYSKAEGAKDVAQAVAVDKSSAQILVQDLVAAGWQCEMAKQWQTSSDPQLFKIVQQQVFNFWTASDGPDFEKLLTVFREQVTEFSLQAMPELNSKAWEDQLRAAALEAIEEMT